MKAAYVRGYEKLNTNGFSSVKVDNTQNNSDVFVKLVSLNMNNFNAVRHFYIPVGGEFTIKKVSPGDYDIRYQDLNTGSLVKSEKFKLEHHKTNNGIEFSHITMTLYKVAYGNMKTFPITESEF